VKVPLRALIIEDSPDDAELVVIELNRAGYEPSTLRVETAEDLRAALRQRTWDVVIADYNMPRFTGSAALTIVQEHDPDLPFILVSGTATDEDVISLLRGGAHDYIAKSKIVRLAPSVERELREHETRRARHRAETCLRFIADATALLGQSLEFETNLAQVASAAVPVYADACVIAFWEEGRLRRIAGVHVDPTKSEQLARVDALLVEAVTRSEKPLLVPDIGSSDVGAPLDPEVVARLRSLDITSVVSAPVLVTGEVVGALGFGVGPGRCYHAVDLATAENLAHRIGLAVNNARLYRATRDSVFKRDEFLAIAAHELRTPLTPLRLQMSYIEQLLCSNDEHSPLLEQLRRRFAIAARQMDRVVRLVETLLDMSRLMRDRLELDPGRVDLGELVRQVVEWFTSDAMRANSTITVHARDGIEGIWDGGRLDQVVTNLLSNAVRYGNGEPIEVRVEDRGEAASFSVRDQGIGISPADRARIFERFERAVPGSHYGGLGMGLWISRRIVEAHGGSIDIESQPGRGSVFTVTLPKRWLRVDKNAGPSTQSRASNGSSSDGLS